MSLLRDIQDATIDANVDITTVLRKCKLLANRLGHKEFSIWVDQELNGYKTYDLIPDYRIFPVHSKGHFSGPMGSMIKNGDIPLGCIPEKYRDKMKNSYAAQPISAYVSLIKESQQKDFHEPWPPEIVAFIQDKVYEMMNCMQAWKIIPKNVLVGLVDTVRNKILINYNICVINKRV